MTSRSTRATKGTKKVARPSLTEAPLSVRMPADLRARLRRYARDRHISEASAFRLIVSEHLLELEAEMTMEQQTALAWEAVEAIRSGKEKVLPADAIEKMFDRLLGPKRRRRSA